MARPRSVMTPEVVAQILKWVELGLWPDRAARMAGVSDAAMRQMKRRDPEFVTQLEKAEAKAEANFHGRIIRHMDKQWTACAWMLERRWPERYAKREEVVQANVSEVPDRRFE